MKLKIFALVLTILSLNACQQNRDPSEAPSSFCAFIRNIDEDVVTVDIAEYITLEDIERINELNLTENDLLNGYYIYNPDEETDEFVLNSAAVYRFIDWGRDFTDSDDPKDVNISTTNIDNFIKYIKTYENAQPGMPFFFETDGNEVISITEKPMA